MSTEFIYEELEYQIWSALRSRDELSLQNMNFRLVRPLKSTKIKSKQELTTFFAEFGMKEDYPEYPLEPLIDN